MQKTYSRIVALGMPFLIVTNGMSNLARADGSPRYSMVCMLIGAVINTILDPVFIFILFIWEFAGAAWATIIGQFFSFIFALLYIRKFKNITLTRKDIGPVCKGMYPDRIPRHEQQLESGCDYICTDRAEQLADLLRRNVRIRKRDPSRRMRHRNEEPNAILLAIIIGISQGSQPIIGFNYGARRYDRVRKTYKLAITANLCISAVGFILFQFFPYQIISLFGTGDAAYFEFSVRFMRIFLFMVIFQRSAAYLVQFLCRYRQTGERSPALHDKTGHLPHPLVLILPLFFGLDGILFAGPAADSIAFIVTICLIAREMKNMKQMEQLT